MIQSTSAKPLLRGRSTVLGWLFCSPAWLRVGLSSLSSCSDLGVSLQWAGPDQLQVGDSVYLVVVQVEVLQPGESGIDSMGE